MNFLLDTHAFIWFMEGNNSLPQSSRQAIENIQNNLKLNAEFGKISDFLESNEIQLLPIGFDHLQKLLSLAYHHRDPFDRIIISQALVEHFTIITKDENFPKYTNNILW